MILYGVGGFLNQADQFILGSFFGVLKNQIICDLAIDNII